MPVLVVRIFLVSFFLLHVSEARQVDGYPQFLIKPNTIYTEPAGANITMKCRATAESNATVEWFSGNENRPLGRELVRQITYIVKRGGTLLITNASLSAEGFYYCTIRNEFGRKKARAAVAILTWPQPAEISGWRSHVVATAGTNVTILCQPDSLSDGIVSIYWQSDTDDILHNIDAWSGKPVPPDMRVYAQSISAFQSELRITNATESDGGIYTCVLDTVLYPRSDVKPVELTIAGNEPVNSEEEVPQRYTIAVSSGFED